MTVVHGEIFEWRLRPYLYSFETNRPTSESGRVGTWTREVIARDRVLSCFVLRPAPYVAPALVSPATLLSAVHSITP
jgi:hypothetical protein